MDKKLSRKHNGIISFWKFMFCIMIVIFHITEKFPREGVLMLHGRIAVEFFFLVSGYLMAKTALNKEDDNNSIAEDTVKYIGKKIKVFFPYVLIGLLISFFVRSLNRTYTTSEIVNSIWELLLIDRFGIKTPMINGITWYIPSMLFSMLIMYPLLRKYKKNFTYIVAPLIVLIVGGWVAYWTENLRNPDLWMMIGYKGTFRAFFEISLGTILYEIAEKMKTIDFTFLGRLLCTIIEIFGFISIFFIVNFPNASSEYDFIMLLILSISITFAFSENNLFYKIANNKLIYYLEKLTLPIYLNQMWMIRISLKLDPSASYGFRIIEILTYLIAFSMLELYIVEKWQKKDKTKIKKIFIKSKVLQDNKKMEVCMK